MRRQYRLHCLGIATLYAEETGYTKTAIPKVTELSGRCTEMDSHES